MILCLFIPTSQGPNFSETDLHNDEMQLLAAGKPCPMCNTPLKDAPIEEFRPNYGLMDIIGDLQAAEPGNASEQAAQQRYQLAKERIRFTRSNANRLGEGGSGVVFRGVLPSGPSLSNAPADVEAGSSC